MFWTAASTTEGCPQAAGEGSLAGASLSGQDPAYNPVKIEGKRTVCQLTMLLWLWAGIGGKELPKINRTDSQHTEFITWSLLLSPSILIPSCCSCFLDHRNRSNQKRLSTTAITTNPRLPISACTRVPYLLCCSPNGPQLQCKANASTIVLAPLPAHLLEDISPATSDSC